MPELVVFMFLFMEKTKVFCAFDVILLIWWGKPKLTEDIPGYVDASIPSILNRFKGLSVHGIIVPDRVTRSRNVQDLTLGWIKLHIPLFSHF